jgi:hypothetical protein
MPAEVIQMFVREDPATGTRVYSVSVEEAALHQRLGPAIMDSFANALTATLVERWLEQHAQQVLEGLTGQKMIEVIQKRLSEQMLASFLKER